MTTLNAERLDRRIKWALLVISLATLALLALSALRENVFASWRIERAKYAKVLQRKATNERGQALASQFRTEIAQNVLPEIHIVDRCVTCHTGMDDPRMNDEPNPFKSHPGDLLATHPPEKFGCVVCHGGQGRATETDDAHGRVPYWPAPLIDKEYYYAGCGACHAHVGVPNYTMLERGRAAAEQYKCLDCHAIDGTGATQAAPDLSRAGMKGRPPKPHKKGSGCALDNPAAPIPAGDRAALDAFLVSRVGAPGLIESKALFNSMGCRGCHQIGGVGGDEGPDISNVGMKDESRMDFSRVSGERTLPNWLRAHLRSPSTIVPTSEMPTLGLPDEQIGRITFYLLSLRRGGISPGFWPKDRVLAERVGEREFATDGLTLFSAFCSACHGLEGEGVRYRGLKAYPAIGGADFLAAASDDFIRANITQGRPAKRMPAWGEKKGGLHPEEIDAIIAALRERAGQPEIDDGKPARWVAAPGPGTRPGEELFLTNCAGCHGQKGEGGEGLALRNKAVLETATDSYLVRTISQGRRGTKMQAFAQASPTHPALAQDEIESIVWFIRSWKETQ